MLLKPYETQSLLSINYHVINQSELFDVISNQIQHNEPINIYNLNIHALNLTFNDPEFKQVLNLGDLVFVDGMGVKIGAKLLGLEVGQRMTPMDWLDDLFELCAQNHWSIFLLGDEHEQGCAFEKKLKERHPNCVLAGFHHGFFSRKGEENQQVIDLINRSQASIVLVGMSMPIQEKWIAENARYLNAPVKIATGAFHRVYTGNIARGPKWMTDNGLEWLYRLFVEPKKTWRRYVLGNPLFLYRILKAKFFGFSS